MSAVIFLPLIGAVAVWLISPNRQQTIRSIALATGLADFLLSLLLYIRFVPGYRGIQFQEAFPWIINWGIWYRLGIDGVSLFLVLLTTFLSVLAIASSWKAITQKTKEYMLFMLLLETGMLGVFCALDLFLFYVFWEAMLVPMYFLIGIWGGPRRIYAAVKFFLFTMAGGVLMLVGILALYFMYHHQTGTYSFNWEDWQRMRLPAITELWLFGAFAIAFAIKVPMLPFHTWLPDAHVEAPTAGSVILAGILLKMGSYGFFRFCLPLFPDIGRVVAPAMGIIAVGGIIYGALVAAVQTDVKRLVAYSSVSHMGFVVLGIFALTPEGLTGASLQMVNHGLSTGALFLLVGMLYERRHTRMIADFGGLSKAMPVFSAFFLLVVLSSLGLPGLNGFVGEFLVLAGSFVKRSAYGGAALACLAATGVILAAIYLLWMFRRVMHGPLTKEENRTLPDLSPREVGILLAIVIPIVAIGVYPKPLLSRMEPSVTALVERVWAVGLPQKGRMIRGAPPQAPPGVMIQTAPSSLRPGSREGRGASAESISATTDAGRMIVPDSRSRSNGEPSSMPAGETGPRRLPERVARSDPDSSVRWR